MNQCSLLNKKMKTISYTNSKAEFMFFIYTKIEISENLLIFT